MKGSKVIQRWLGKRDFSVFLFILYHVNSPCHTSKIASLAFFSIHTLNKSDFVPLVTTSNVSFLPFLPQKTQNDPKFSCLHFDGEKGSIFQNMTYRITLSMFAKNVMVWFSSINLIHMNCSPSWCLQSLNFLPFRSK